MKTLMHRHASIFALLVAMGAAPAGLAYGQTPAKPAGAPAAQDLSGKQKAEALRHLAAARTQLEQAQALGYLAADKGANLTAQVAAAEALLQRNQNASAAFAKLRADLGTASDEQSATQRRGRAGS